MVHNVGGTFGVEAGVLVQGFGLDGCHCDTYL